jgi:protein-S-isoprenylcysteine O-methyltransferase Ste14
MHVGMWGLAAIVIVIVSWLLYRYLAPDNWKEWAGAGVLQAFIIAFYAEMYGFPLTIYFLSRFFGLDMAWTKGGNLWEQLFGTPVAHIVAMVLGYTIVFGGATLVADGWRLIHRARREQMLMTDGVYARMRHPQYTGLFLIVFGEGVVHWPTIVSVAAFPIIVIAYTLLARKEERQMIEKFGDAYCEYQRRVPMFIPVWQAAGGTRRRRE